MNREIKFRGKRLKNDIWVYGLLTNDMKGHYRINFDPKSFSCVVKENTIGQFTGLRDKNGNEIYQHDIIQLQGKENKYNCLVDWNINLGAWCISIENKCLGVKPLGEWLLEDRFVVIGNIFDNPELWED